jgi:hypothetical protein
MTFADFEDFWAPFDGRESAFATYVAGLDAAQKGEVQECAAPCLS